MTKDELVALSASAAASVFASVQGFVPEGYKVTGELSDTDTITRFAQVEAGRSYYIAKATFLATEAEKDKRNGSSKWLDLFEVESGAPARLYWGVLGRNSIALTKCGFNGTVGKAKESVGKFLTVSAYDRGELKSDGTRDIKINYNVVDNI